MSLRTGKPFEDFEKSGEGDYHDFLYDQYIALQKENEELKEALSELDELFNGNGVPNVTWVKNRIKQALKEQRYERQDI